MKILKGILLTFVVLIVLLLAGVVVFVKTFDVNKYLPQISTQIGNTINRKVIIGHANLNIGFKGLSVELKNISVSDDPAFSSKNFLTLDSAYASLDIMPLIEKKQINVIQLTLSSPNIFIVRLADGRLNAESMAPAPQAASVEKAPASNPSVVSSSPAALPAILVKSILVEHLQVSLEDQNPQMPVHVQIPDGNIAINNFSLSDPFDFTVGLDAWSQKGNNITVTGHCQLDLAKTAVHVSGLVVKTDLSQWDLGKIKAVTPMLDKLAIWPQGIKGNLVIDIADLNASAKGLDGLKLQVGLTEGSLKLKELLNPIEPITFKANTDLSNFTLEQLQAKINQGEINLQAQVQGMTTSPTYNFKFETKSLKVDELVDQSKAPVAVKGVLDAQFNGSGSSFDPQSLMNNLKVTGQFSLSNGEVDRLNILKMVLGKLDFIPGMGNLLVNAAAAALPANLKDQLNSDTTTLDKAEGKVSLENKVLTIQEGDLESKLFAINATGTVDLDLNANINVKTYLGADLSAALIKNVSPLQGLLDEQNRIYIPGQAAGKYPDIKYQPQVDYITKKVAIAAGSQQLQKVFSKNSSVGNMINSVLGGGSSQSSDSQGQANNSSSPVNNLLNKFFQ